MENVRPHKFHIPVMGLAYTVDTPVRVAKYGITSVVSIIEDHLLEKMREVLCKNEQIEYVPILATEEDSRAKRVTAFLNQMQDIIDSQVEKLKYEDFNYGENIKKYFELLPSDAYARILYNKMLQSNGEQKFLLKRQLRSLIVAGNIDVNIMTKLDKTNYDKSGKELPVEFSDAHAALRGYANSKLKSSIIFSAGLNPRLFAYCEGFDDFYPNSLGIINKKIILKVSDYRSALIQGKFFAKKGLWVSEFRVESGINCGGHAFISNGTLLGPILEEFKNKRDELLNELWDICESALNSKGINQFIKKPTLNITAQGGIGTSDESKFLLDYYNLNATGWGSPFLLVPEVTNVDKGTLGNLANAHKDDYYLSHASPLGVPYNNFKRSSSEMQRKKRIENNKPGSPCYKEFLVSNTEFTSKPICTASREYQNLKIKQLKKEITDLKLMEQEINKVLEKDCLCEGLGAAALLKNNTKLSHNLSAVNICPGPNLAYFTGVFTLKQMVDHIYGRINILNKNDRPNLFINELQLYVDYLKKELEDTWVNLSEKKLSYYINFKDNLLKGIEYYESILPKLRKHNLDFKNGVLQQLLQIKSSLNLLPQLQNR